MTTMIFQADIYDDQGNLVPASADGAMLEGYTLENDTQTPRVYYVDLGEQAPDLVQIEWDKTVAVSGGFQGTLQDKATITGTQGWAEITHLIISVGGARAYGTQMFMLPGPLVDRLRLRIYATEAGKLLVTYRVSTR